MVALHGTVTMAAPEFEARLTGDGQELRLDLGNPPAFFRALGAGLPRGLENLRVFSAGLDRLGLTLRVTGAGSELLVLGRDARPGLTARLLRVPHLEVRERRAVVRMFLPR